jgi:hypothetical protein
LDAPKKFLKVIRRASGLFCRDRWDAHLGAAAEFGIHSSGGGLMAYGVDAIEIC